MDKKDVKIEPTIEERLQAIEILVKIALGLALHNSNNPRGQLDGMYDKIDMLKDETTKLNAPCVQLVHLALQELEPLVLR